MQKVFIQGISMGWIHCQCISLVWPACGGSLNIAVWEGVGGGAGWEETGSPAITPTRPCNLRLPSHIFFKMIFISKGPIEQSAGPKTRKTWGKISSDRVAPAEIFVLSKHLSGSLKNAYNVVTWYMVKEAIRPVPPPPPKLESVHGSRVAHVNWKCVLHS